MPKCLLTYLGVGLDECKYSQRGKEDICIQHFDIPFLLWIFKIKELYTGANTLGGLVTR